MINFDQDFILESPNGRLSNCPTPTNNSHRQLKRTEIERNSNSENDGRSNSERTDEEQLSAESTKHKKRPKLSFATFTSRLDPVSVSVCTSGPTHVPSITSGPIFPSLSLLPTSFPVENMKSENTQTSPIILPRTRSLSVSTDFTDDLPLM